MIAVVARVAVKAGKSDEFLKEAKIVVEETRKENGCISYEGNQNTEDPLKFAIIEKWESKECLDAHMQTAHFKNFVAALGGLAAEETVIDVYSPLK